MKPYPTLLLCTLFVSMSAIAFAQSATDEAKPEFKQFATTNASVSATKAYAASAVAAPTLMETRATLDESGQLRIVCDEIANPHPELLHSHETVIRAGEEK